MRSFFSWKAYRFILFTILFFSFGKGYCTSTSLKPSTDEHISDDFSQKAQKTSFTETQETLFSSNLPASISLALPNDLVKYTLVQADLSTFFKIRMTSHLVRKLTQDKSLSLPETTQDFLAWFNLFRGKNQEDTINLDSFLADFEVRNRHTRNSDELLWSVFLDYFKLDQNSRLLFKKRETIRLNSDYRQLVYDYRTSRLASTLSTSSREEECHPTTLPSSLETLLKVGQPYLVALYLATMINRQYEQNFKSTHSQDDAEIIFSFLPSLIFGNSQKAQRKSSFQMRIACTELMKVWYFKQDDRARYLIGEYCPTNAPNISRPFKSLEDWTLRPNNVIGSGPQYDLEECKRYMEILDSSIASHIAAGVFSLETDYKLILNLVHSRCLLSKWSPDSLSCTINASETASNPSDKSTSIDDSKLLSAWEKGDHEECKFLIRLEFPYAKAYIPITIEEKDKGLPLLKEYVEKLTNIISIHIRINSFNLYADYQPILDFIEASQYLLSLNTV